MINKQKSVQLPFFFDVKKLQSNLFIAEEYQWEEVASAYMEKDSMFGLDLFVPDMDKIIPGEGLVFKPSEVLEESNYFQEVFSHFKTEILRARLNKLKSKSFILPHRDSYGFDRGAVRVHIPILTNDGFCFNIEDERIVMKDGECWYVNTLLQHDVINKGTEDRTHLVVDLKLNDWLKEVLVDLGFVDSI